MKKCENTVYASITDVQNVGASELLTSVSFFKYQH